MKSYKNLYALISQLIYKATGKRVQISEKDFSVSSPNVSSSASIADSAREVFEAIKEGLINKILTGLEVKAEDPPSQYVTVYPGRGVALAKTWEITDEMRIHVPLDDETHVFYLNLYNDTIQVERQKYNYKLAIAKIVVPNPGVTTAIQDDDEDNGNAFIVSGKDWLFDNTYEVDDETRAELKNMFVEIPSAQLSGNITLAEGVKLTTLQGTVCIDSTGMFLYNPSNPYNPIAKFTKRGVDFFNPDTNAHIAHYGSYTKIGAFQNFMIDENGLFGYDNYGRPTTKLQHGSLCLIDPLCEECYSYLDSGALKFHHPYGDIPYAKRIKSGEADGGTTVCLEQWYCQPELILSIKSLLSYDTTKSGSCQCWETYHDNLQSYDNGSGDFGWKFDVHSKLVVSGGQYSECIHDVAFGTEVSTHTDACETLVKVKLQSWCNDVNYYYYGHVCYCIGYKAFDSGTWCYCNYDYTQPHADLGELKTTYACCHTLIFGTNCCWDIKAVHLGANYTSTGWCVGEWVCCSRWDTANNLSVSLAYRSCTATEPYSTCCIACSDWSSQVNPGNVFCEKVYYCLYQDSYACVSSTGVGRATAYNAGYGDYLSYVSVQYGASCCDPVSAGSKEHTYTSYQYDYFRLVNYAYVCGGTAWAHCLFACNIYRIICWCEYTGGTPDSCLYECLYSTTDKSGTQEILDEGKVSYLAIAYA